MSNFVASALRLENVSHGYGPRLLFDQANLTIPPGEHAVVVGENGAGKSTLIRLLAGRELPDSGKVLTSAGITVVDQVQNWPEGASLTSALDAAMEELRGLEAQMRDLEQDLSDPARADSYDAAATEFALRGGFGADAEFDAALDQLGVGNIPRSRALTSLSGGEQMRVALALALVDSAPVLLLDEPSNHLDEAGLSWMENRLMRLPGTVLIVSHDRTLLERFAQTVIEVDADRASIHRYGNGYQGYLKEKRAERERWGQQYDQWLLAKERERSKAEAVTERLGYERETDKNKMAYDRYTGLVQQAARSQIRNAQERLRRLEEHPVEKPPLPLKFAARNDSLIDQGPTGSADPLLITKGFIVPGRLEVGSFVLKQFQKTLVIGPNGAGKTTFLSALAGELEIEGELRRRPGLRLGYLPQEIRPPARPEQRLLSAFMVGRIGSAEEQAEDLLSLGLFRTADFATPVGSLSAGQFRRLELARLLAAEHHALLIDEPSNHLAPTLQTELEEFFQAFGGALVIVSHDRALRQRFDSVSGGRVIQVQDARVPSDVADNDDGDHQVSQSIGAVAD